MKLTEKDFDLPLDQLRELVKGAQEFLPPVDPRDNEKLTVDPDEDEPIS